MVFRRKEEQIPDVQDKIYTQEKRGVVAVRSAEQVGQTALNGRLDFIRNQITYDLDGYDMQELEARRVVNVKNRLRFSGEQPTDEVRAVTYAVGFCEDILQKVGNALSTGNLEARARFLAFEFDKDVVPTAVAFTVAIMRGMGFRVHESNNPLPLGERERQRELPPVHSYEITVSGW